MWEYFLNCTPLKKGTTVRTRTILSLSGPSGAGKTMLAEMLINHFGSNAEMVKSTTTRAPRKTDLPDEFRYIDQDEFTRMIRQSEFAWAVEHGSGSYGTEGSILAEALVKNFGVGVMILTPGAVGDLHSFLKVLTLPDCRYFPVFVLSPGEAQLKGRLRKRGDLAEEKITLRLKQEESWEKDARESNHGFHFIQNDSTPENAFREVLRLLQ